MPVGIETNLFSLRSLPACRNEPDLSSTCVTYTSWLDYYTLQSMAIQNAYADLNADVAAGRIPCPVASCAGGAFSPLIYASAFSSATFGGVSNSTTTPSLFLSDFPNDFYSYYGQVTVQNEHTTFPVSPSKGQLSLQQSRAVQNMNAFSLHSYGAALFFRFPLSLSRQEGAV